MVKAKHFEDVLDRPVNLSPGMQSRRVRLADLSLASQCQSRDLIQLQRKEVALAILL